MLRLRERVADSLEGSQRAVVLRRSSGSNPRTGFLTALAGAQGVVFSNGTNAHGLLGRGFSTAAQTQFPKGGGMICQPVPDDAMY